MNFTCSQICNKTDLQFSITVNPFSLYKLNHLGLKYTKLKILPLVLCGYEVWFLTSGEVHRVRVFENRLVRRIFEPKRNVMIGEWRKIHSEERQYHTTYRIKLGQSDKG